MADEPLSIEEGAPIPKDQPDPELIRLRGPRPKVGLITAAGLVFLSVLFLVRLNPDRRFSGAPDQPDKVSVADVLGGNVALDRYITVDAEPLASHALRSTTSKASLGLRAVPARGTGDRLWLVVSGDGWEAPQLKGYAGRLRRLAELPFAASLRDYTQEHPRPVFAGPDAVRAGLATGQVSTVTGDTVAVRDADRVAFDVIDPDAAVIVCTFTKLKNAADWQQALAAAGIPAKPTAATIQEEARFEVSEPGAVADVTAKLDHAQLFARVDPVAHHQDTTWGGLRASPPPGFAHADLVGLYVARTIPDDAYAVITGEKPQDYWYVPWIAIALGAVAIVFAWALVRAVRRDLFAARVT
jgi:hypothetical protein